MKGYRTVLFNILMAAVAMARAAGWIEDTPSAEEVGVFVDNFDKVITVIWLAGNIVLRALTDTPIGRKQ